MWGTECGHMLDVVVRLDHRAEELFRGILPSQRVGTAYRTRSPSHRLRHRDLWLPGLSDLSGSESAQRKLVLCERRPSPDGRQRNHRFVDQRNFSSDKHLECFIDS